MRNAVGAFSVFLPCPVGKFAMSELEEARRWLRESLGTIQQQEIGDGILHLSLRGKLDGEAYANDLEDLNRYMAQHEKLRLLIDLRDFDGWQGLGALKDHFDLVRGHASRVERAARELAEARLRRALLELEAVEGSFSAVLEDSRRSFADAAAR